MVGVLGLNALTQLGGATMMLVAPGEAAQSVMKMASTQDVDRAIATIGGVTLSFFVASVAAAVLTWRERREGYVLTVMQGCMLAIIGVVMLLTKTYGGAVDVAKGLVLVLCATWGARTESARQEFRLSTRSR